MSNSYKAFATCVAALATLVLVRPASAQNLWQLNGVPICVLPECGGLDLSIAPDDSGGVFVRYLRTFNGNYDQYLQHVLADGRRDTRWPLAGVPASLDPHDQYASHIVSDGFGGLYIAWQEVRTVSIDVYAQHILANGLIAPGWPADGMPVALVPGTQQFPRLAADGASGVYVVWHDERTGNATADVYAQHFNHDGTRPAGWPENGLPVSATPGRSAFPSACSDGAGGVFVAWSDGRGPNYGQHLKADGSIAAGWQVDGNPINTVATVGVVIGLVPDGQGGAYMGADKNEDFNHDVFATRFTADGAIVPGWPVVACGIENSQTLTSVSGDGVGGLLLAWYGSGLGGPGVYALRLQPDGNRAPGWQACGNKVSASGTTQYDPIIVSDGVGGSYVTFTSSPRAFIQKLTPDGAPAPGWTPSAVFVDLPQSSMSYAAMTTDARGGAITAWLDRRFGVGGSQIYVQRYGGDGPTPAQVSLVSAFAEPDRVTLTWHTPDPAGVLATIYRRTQTTDWVELARERFDGEGQLRYDDVSVARSTRYAYRLGIVENGAESFTEETWVDVPAAYELALEGVRPNPAVHELRVAFSLPSSAPASLELIDIGGRQVMSRPVNDLGAGRHLVQLGDARHVPPGVYWVRLRQGSRSHTMRAVVVR